MNTIMSSIRNQEIMAKMSNTIHIFVSNIRKNGSECF